MCELLVCAHDQTNPDVFINYSLMKRGDVVDAKEDGHNWSIEEMTSPLWRIIKAPALALADAQPLLMGEMTNPPSNPPTPNKLQYRGYFLNDAAVVVPADFAAYLADDTRAVAFWTDPVGITLAAVLTQRPPVS